MRRGRRRALAPATPPRAPPPRRRAGSPAPPAGVALVRPGEEGARRARQDLQVDPRRAMLDIPDVELDALIPRHARAAVDLRPAGDPRLDVEPASLSRRVLLDLVRERGTGADQAHVSAHHIPELRDLVDRQAAQDAAGARDPRVTFVHGITGALALGADLHRAELHQLELPAAQADAPLPVQHRPAVV